MPVAVLMPHQKQENRQPEKDPLDVIIKGLNIASSIYGFKEASDKAKVLQEQKAADAERYERDWEYKNKQDANAENWRQKNYEQEDRKINQSNLERQKARLEKEQAKNSELPEDQKLIVSELSKKNAAKIGIANQIDSVMGNWDKLSDDQKLSSGRQLLKTLNSPEGADAIGAEEANRLGSRLEFAMGNFTNSNPTQFGRDLPGFKEQAVNTSNSLKGAIQSNQNIINNAYGDPNRKTAIGSALAGNNTLSENQIAKLSGVNKEDAIKELIKRKGIGAMLPKMGGKN